MSAVPRHLRAGAQGYTQYGGLRPFGVSLLYAGWDAVNGFQLYQSNPSGNFDGERSAPFPRISPAPACSAR